MEIVYRIHPAIGIAPVGPFVIDPVFDEAFLDLRRELAGRLDERCVIW
jgi:hypothetical protein